MTSLIIECFEKYNFKLSEKQISELSMLVSLTLEKNKLLNLTSIKDQKNFVDKMIVDSSLLLTSFDMKNKFVLDLGTGAGFPGLVLAILSPSTRFLLLDSTTKKSIISKKLLKKLV